MAPRLMGRLVVLWLSLCVVLFAQGVRGPFSKVSPRRMVGALVLARWLGLKVGRIGKTI